ncbi:transporter substrate-binding domain-containing protein [Rheinheimera riviphila]|uniref:Transporter substrate-binding domain-containing protein n=1 Tax=Rheinheimera riviphila TaxID=1834037 RepID=A0A437R217_9GAMM|nr:transporter substrate-binding domain-containing protein [Rheinheimera riviphila]RVU40763.1 transporter substrate-binding domain-containing protein [Rheinheimera riviphila]
MKALNVLPGFWLLLFLACLPLQASTIRVCVEDFDYYPHYDFHKLPGRGFAAELFEMFSKNTGIKLQIIPMPAKRLHDNPLCQLIYPDNPLWHTARGTTQKVFFSLPLTEIIGSSVVRKGEGQLTLSEIRSIAIVRGFTPDHLLSVQSEHQFEFVETSNATAALMMLLKRRVDAADVEWHVAQYQLTQAGQKDAVEIGQLLPLSSVGFHLSSQNHGNVLQIFDTFLRENAEQVKNLKDKLKLKTIAELKLELIPPVKKPL